MSDSGDRGGHGEKIGRKQEQAISALLTQPTIGKAAKSCGVSAATLWRWMQEPDFQKSFRQARLRVVEVAIAGLQQAASEAVITLRRNLRAEQEGVQVRAAVAILEHATKAIELMDLENRVQALEASLSSAGSGSGQRTRPVHVTFGPREGSREG